MNPPKKENHHFIIKENWETEQKDDNCSFQYYMDRRNVK